MPDEVVTTPFGKFYVNPDDLIGSTLKAGTCWDGPQFLQVIARRWGQLDDPRSVILDVGANQGEWAIWLASQGQAQIVAVEPVPETVQRLQANLDLNQRIAADRIVVLPIVAGARRGHAQLATYDPSNTGGASFVADDEAGTFQVQPLDAFSWLWSAPMTRVTIVKIDTQGWDWAVLAGLTDTLLVHSPVVVLEDERGPKAAEEAFRAWRATKGFPHYQFVKWPSRADDYLLIPW